MSQRLPKDWTGYRGRTILAKVSEFDERDTKSVEVKILAVGRVELITHEPNGVLLEWREGHIRKSIFLANRTLAAVLKGDTIAETWKIAAERVRLEQAKKAAKPR
ncbi:MAG: hypothetical protein PHE55_05070 [Methylococcaceae bacterium]|nr:hypothetical protein [Methylococcaceae bacterium]